MPLNIFFANRPLLLLGIPVDILSLQNKGPQIINNNRFRRNYPYSGNDNPLESRQFLSIRWKSPILFDLLKSVNVPLCCANVLPTKIVEFVEKRGRSSLSSSPSHALLSTSSSLDTAIVGSRGHASVDDCLCSMPWRRQYSACLLQMQLYSAF